MHTWLDGESPSRKMTLEKEACGLRRVKIHKVYSHTAMPASLQERFVLFRPFYQPYKQEGQRMIQTLEEFCEWLDPSVSPRILQKKSLLVAFFALCEKKRKEYCLFWLAKRGGGYRPVSFSFPGSETGSRGILSLLAYGEIAPPSYSCIAQAGIYWTMPPHMSDNQYLSNWIYFIFWQYSFSVGLFLRLTVHCPKTRKLLLTPKSPTERMRGVHAQIPLTLF